MLKEKQLHEFTKADFDQIIKMYAPIYEAAIRAYEDTPAHIHNEVCMYSIMITDNLKFLLQTLRGMKRNAINK